MQAQFFIFSKIFIRAQHRLYRYRYSSQTSAVCQRQTYSRMNTTISRTSPPITTSTPSKGKRNATTSPATSSPILIRYRLHCLSHFSYRSAFKLPTTSRKVSHLRLTMMIPRTKLGINNLCSSL